jgi:hypothetical protein
VEELQAAITQGLTTIQPDSYAYNSVSGYWSLHNSPITITDKVTIDGKNSVTIQRLGYSANRSKKPTFIIEEGGELTLKDITINGAGGDMNGASMIIVNGGTLILDNATLQKTGASASGSAIRLVSGNVIMKDGSAVAAPSPGTATALRF